MIHATIGIATAVALLSGPAAGSTAGPALASSASPAATSSASPAATSSASPAATSSASAVVVPATGAAVGPRSHPGYHQTPDQLTLSYQAQAGYAAAIKLTCNPTGGFPQQAARICATLTETDANPDKIKPAHQLCMMIYSPITAELTGTWHGTPLHWTYTYGNQCEMQRATGVLFQF